MADGIADDVRLLLQGGIQDVLASFKKAGMHEREDLNTLITFYRAMHTMSLSAIKLERELEGILLVNSTRKANGLFREFGNGLDSGLHTPAAEENPDLQLAGRNADGDGVEGGFEDSESIGEGGTSHFVLNFGGPKGINLVR